ncbi:hypothetical protein IV203_011994 [Nitzschia inconspicua]|uniref:Uncharacterized protein n=1 Tax=Nitzschia inconspicua TaxID=303405 RepID=A0A9K3KTD1_9STRA|nr:hypothetical protein IV203_011994 [Nitzschia inconspicua]
MGDWKPISTKYIRETVKELEGERSTMTEVHIRDLKYVSLYLYNDLCRPIRNGSTGGKPFFLNKILKQSNIIEEVEGMRGTIDLDEIHSKNYLISHYHGQEMEVRCHVEAKTMEAFTSRRNYIKDHVILAVCKAYRLWHTSTRKREEREREELIDLDDLNRRVIANIRSSI